MLVMLVIAIFQVRHLVHVMDMPKLWEGPEDITVKLENDQIGNHTYGIPLLPCNGVLPRGYLYTCLSMPWVEAP